MLTLKDIDFLTQDKLKRDRWREDALKKERKLSHKYNILKEDLLKKTYFRKLEFIDCRGTEELNQDGAPMLHLCGLNNWFIDTCSWKSHNDFAIRVAVPIRRGLDQSDWTTAYCSTPK